MFELSAESSGESSYVEGQKNTYLRLNHLLYFVFLLML